VTFTESQLASMRATVESMLPDRCTIRQPGSTAFDAGTYTSTTGAVVYEGPCRVHPQGRSDAVVQAGEEPVTQRTYDVTLPSSASGIEVDHVLTVTESADPDLVGRPLRVRDAKVASVHVQRRLVVEDTS
jgi:hypothetical protein